MRSDQVLPHTIVPWTKDHDASNFTSNLQSITKYIQDQAHRDVSSFASSIFVLTAPGDLVIRGFYSLSSISLIYSDLPDKAKKRLSRYPQVSGILLGRLGVDRDFSEKLYASSGIKPRFGEFLLTDAQLRCLKITKEIGSALLVIDAEQPSAQDLTTGARDPLNFYLKYGFTPLTSNPRRLIKSMRAIAAEFKSV
jgi:hypothetical protein